MTALTLPLAANPDRRIDQRVPCTPFETSLIIRESGEAVAVEVINVSAAGLGLRAPRPLDIGAKARVPLTSNSVEGWICHCREIAGGRYDVGLLIGYVIETR
jgi:hypothetical protein